MSDLLPHLASVADELCVIRSMVGQQPLHGQQNLLLHTGRVIGGAPSFGSWVSYALGSPSDSLPNYVVLNNEVIPNGGLRTYGSAFLPTSHAATMLRANGIPMDNIAPFDLPAVQRRKLELLREQDAAFAQSTGDDAIDSAIKNYETRLPHADLDPGADGREPRKGSRHAICTAWTTLTSSSDPTACSASEPAAWWKPGFASSKSPAPSTTRTTRRGTSTET